MDYRIKTPCSQNWNEMVPSANSRFCLHCQKEVYDLSNGKTLPNIADNFCGRIAVNTPAEEISFKKLAWRQNPIKYILFASLLLFTRNMKAQIADKNVGENNTSNKNQADSVTKTITISGKLINKKTKEAIPSAHIKAYDNLNNFLGTTITDANGNYNLELNKVSIKGKNIRLQATYDGYDPINVTDIPIRSNKQNIKISLKEQHFITGDILAPEELKESKK